MNTTFSFNRYVVADGSNLTLELTENIVTQEPHPDDVELMIVWTREEQYGDDR